MPSKFPIDTRPTVLIDFDDTLAEYSGYKGWKNLGKPRKYALTLIRLFRSYKWTVILYTCRSEIGLLRDWLKHYKFVDSKGKQLVDYINQNPLNAKIDANPSKPVADLIIDNAAFPYCGRPVPLDEVIHGLLDNGILTGDFKKDEN